MENGKRSIVWLSNHPKIYSGLGRNTRNILEYLYKTEKYNIICYAMGCSWDNPDNLRFPYKIVGALPNSQEELNQIVSQYPAEQREGISKLIQYGAYNIDKVIKEFKPDLLCCSDDVWGFPMQAFFDKPWFNHINTLFQITIDSKPVMEEAREQARRQEKKGAKYYTWLDFSKKWMEELGHTNVEVLTGAICPKPFYKKTFGEKNELRSRFNLPKDSLIFGFVFRNQLRKEVSPLLDGFSQFVKKHPESNSYVLLHTNFSEDPNNSWNIPKIIEDYKLDNNKILVTHICKNCGEIEIRPFIGQDKDCRFCGTKGVPCCQENPQGSGQITTNIMYGCTEDQLNDVYNLMDFYIHPITNGGLEITMIEALYCEIPIATVNYSCGETFCEQSFVTEIDFEWTRQQGSNFRRALPKAFSICKIMSKFWKMKMDKRAELGKAGRDWALNKFSPFVVGKQLEDIIDSFPEVNYDYSWDEKFEEKDPNAIIDNSIVSDSEWVEQLYNKIMKRPSDLDGKNFWIGELVKSHNRPGVENSFRQIAAQENQKNKQVTLEDIFGYDTKKEDRILFNIPESLGDCLYISALLTDLRSLYPDKKIFLATKMEYVEFFQPMLGIYFDSIILWQPIFNNTVLMEKDYVLIDYLPTAASQCFLNYLRGGQDKTNIDFSLALNQEN